jgi:hypothetical protein
LFDNQVFEKLMAQAELWLLSSGSGSGGRKHDGEAIPAEAPVSVRDCHEANANQVRNAIRKRSFVTYHKHSNSHTGTERYQ